MKTIIASRYALSIGVATALLAGCGASHLPATNSPSSVVRFAFTHHMTFRYTGKKQTFKIPRGVTRIGVIAVAGNGGGSVTARGGRVSAVISVGPSETLAIYVGGEGTKSGSGFNGGGAGGRSPEFFGGYGAGGASDVRRGADALTDRVIVAGGGGGQGGNGGSSSTGGQGGSGGARTGGSGKPGSCSVCGGGGSGGTQQQGGTGGGSLFGNSGRNGDLGHGGVGGSGCDSATCGYPGSGGGGGGGGYYGGGGGGGGVYDGTMCVCSGGGGGGGSSYVEPSATNVRMERGWKGATGNGLVVLSW